MSKQPIQPPPLAFNTGIKRKLCLPLHPTTNQPICACGTVVDIFGDHIFKCTRICKIVVHNALRDSFAHALAPVLSTTGFVPHNSIVDTEPNLYLPSDPYSCLFDLSFDPYPALPPLTSHGCTSHSHTVSANITISSLPAKLPLDSNTPDVLQVITANADSHLRKYEQNRPIHFYYHSRQHTHRQPTSLKHANDPFNISMDTPILNLLSPLYSLLESP